MVTVQGTDDPHLESNSIDKTKQFKKNKSIDDDPKLTSCGVGSWRPSWLQVFNNTKIFLIHICIIGILQSMAGSLQYTVMNMLEKRFAFDSKISAIINIFDNISAMLLSPIIGYYAIQYNRARLIGFGQVIIAAACFISASPYFFYGPAVHFLHKDTSISTTTFSNRTSSSQMCNLDESSADNCTINRGSTVWGAVILFGIGQFFRGVGNAIYYVIAMPLIDDSVPKKSSPIYIAVMQTVMLIGPASGLIVFSFFLKLYEDPWNDPGLSKNDPRFIGAYWLCYLIVGLLILIVCFPMFFYPEQFKNAPVKSAILKKQMKESGGTRQALKRFFNNKLLLLFFLGNATRYSGIIGFYMFYVKYIETTYRISTAETSQYLGSASMAPMAIGIFSGGVIISFFRPKARNFFIFLFFAELASVFTFGSGLFLGCSPIKLQGNVESDQTFSLQSQCNANCHCTTRVFSPLCETATQTTYFSPCYGGCSNYDFTNKTYDSCSCFPSGTATSGYCPGDVSKCTSNLITFVVIMIFGNLISSTSTTGNFLINYRAVEPMDKSFASGLISTLVSIFSFIPVPLLYGHIADSSCLVWEYRCGKRGNCWVYDNDKFRNVIFGVTALFLALGSFFDFLMIFYADQMKSLYDDDEPAKEELPENNNDFKMKHIQNS